MAITIRSNCYISNTVIKDACIQNKIIRRAKFSKSSLSAPKIIGSTFFDPKLEDVQLYNGLIKKACFNNITALGSWSRTNIWDSTFSYGMMNSQKFIHTKFNNVSFKDIFLYKTTFHSCTFVETEFENCYLTQVTFENCVFTGTYSRIKKNLNKRVKFINCTFTSTTFSNCGFWWEFCAHGSIEGRPIISTQFKNNTIKKLNFTNCDVQGLKNLNILHIIEGKKSTIIQNTTEKKDKIVKKQNSNKTKQTKVSVIQDDDEDDLDAFDYPMSYWYYNTEKIQKGEKKLYPFRFSTFDV